MCARVCACVCVSLCWWEMFSGKWSLMKIPHAGTIIVKAYTQLYALVKVCI